MSKERVNPFVGKEAVLDDLLRFIEAKGVSAAMLRVWSDLRDQADGLKAYREEEEEEGDADLVEDLREWVEGELEAILDNYDEAREFVEDEYADLLQAAPVFEKWMSREVSRG